MIGERTDARPAGDVLVHVQRDVGVALHRQIEASIRDGIRAGRLARGIALPPTRLLARDLGVSRGVVVEAYQQLVAEGYLTSQAGGYTRVAIDPEPAAEARTRRAGEQGADRLLPVPRRRLAVPPARRGCARSAACSSRPRPRTSAT